MARKAKSKAIRPPSVQYIEGLAVELATLYGADDTRIDQMRALAEGTEAVNLPDKLAYTDFRYRDNTIGVDRQRITAMLTLNPPKCQVTPARVSDETQRNATKREKWTSAVLEEAGQRVPGLPTLVAVTDANIGDGGGWSKFLFARDLWDVRYSIDETQFDDEYDDAGAVKRSRTQQYNDATEEAKKEAGCPFVWLYVDPRSVYPVYSGTKLREVLEVQERPEITTFSEYRLSRDAAGRVVPEQLGAPGYKSPAAATVKFLQHWTETHCTQVVSDGRDGSEGQQVAQWEHGYGRPPYFSCLGKSFGYWRNRKVGWSVSEVRRTQIEYLNFLRSVYAQIVARDATGILYSELSDTAGPIIGVDGAPEQTDVKMLLGTIVQGRRGETLKVLEWPDVARSLREEIAMVTADLQKSANPHLPEIIGTGDQSGFAIYQQLTEMRVEQDPNAQSIERMLTELTRFAWHLVRTKVRETVWVYRDGDGQGWLSLGPDDLEGGVSVKWTLDPERPSNKLMEGRYHGEQVERGFESLDQAIEAQGRNPDEVLEGRILDYIRQQPEYLQAAKERVAQEAGRGSLVAKALALIQQAQQAQMMAQGGMPMASQESVTPQGVAQDMGQIAQGQPAGAGPGLVMPQASMQAAFGG